MRIYHAVLGCVLSTVFVGGKVDVYAQAQAKSTVAIDLVTELPVHEVHDGLISHSGHFWFGRHNEAGAAGHQIQVYAADGMQLIGKATIPHTVMRIYPYSNNSVLVLGITQDPVLSHLSVVSLRGGEISVKTRLLPERFLISHFARYESRSFAVEAGGMQVLEYDFASNHITMPHPEEYEDQHATVFPWAIRGPGNLFGKSGKIWVIEGRNFALGDEQIRVLPNAYANGVRLLREGTYSVDSMLPVENQDLVVASDPLNSALILLDSVNLKIKQTLGLSGTRPRGITQFGKCVLVANEGSKSLSVVDVSAQQGATEIASWDITPAGDRLKSLRTVAADAETGTILVRSAYFCGSCSNTQSSVFRVAEIGNRAVTKHCLGQLE